MTIEKKFRSILLNDDAITNSFDFIGVTMNFLMTPSFLYLPKVLITLNIPPDSMDMAIIPVRRKSIWVLSTLPVPIFSAEIERKSFSAPYKNFFMAFSPANFIHVIFCMFAGSEL